MCVDGGIVTVLRDLKLQSKIVRVSLAEILFDQQLELAVEYITRK